VASDVFLKIEEIPGDSQVKGHEKEMEVQGWSVSASFPPSKRSGGGSGSAGTSVHADLSVTKQIDEASNKLHEACWTGKTIPKAILTQQRAGEKGGAKVDYLRLTLGDVLITSISQSGGPGSIPTETIALNYSTIKREYRTTDVKGKSGGWQSEGWNVATEEKL
jgi:type VI secretion system secreted protein Hcp